MRTFLGSSSEAYDRIARPLRLKLQQEASRRKFPLQVMSWQDNAIFRNSEHPLEALLRELKASEFGIFIFARDDAINLRDVEQLSPRDNVIFEAGMFISDLNRDRVFIVVERDARVLSDYKGLQYLEFNACSEADISASCEDISKQIIDEMVRKPPVREVYKDIVLDRYWLSKTTAAQRERLHFIEASLLAVNNTRPMQTPISVGTEACIDIYTEALDHVTQRFWTTTFFTSGFWLSSAGRVLAANRLMLDRVRNKSGASVRRLFLLPIKYESFLVAEGQEVASRRRLGDDAFLSRKEREIQQVENYIRALIAADCEVRIGFDDDSHLWSGLLTDELRDRADPNDTEIAIYDNSRIDMYRGGRTGHIARATLFPS